MNSDNKILTWTASHKKTIFVILLILFIILIASRYSLVEVNISSGNESGVYFNNIDTSESKEYKIKSKKIILVPKGNYSIDLYSGNNSSVYYSSFRGFSFNKVNLTTKDQKLASYLGESSFRCVQPLKQGHGFIGYSCNSTLDHQGIEAIYNNSTDSLLNIDDVYEKIKNVNIDFSSGIEIKKYNNSFLVVFKDSEGSLVLQKINHDGTFDTPKVYKNITIDNIKDSNIATDIQNKQVAILSVKESKIFIINTEKDTLKEQKLKKPKDRDLDNATILVNKNSTYIIDGFAHIDSLEAGHMNERGESEGHDEETPNTDPLIIKMELSSDKTTVTKLPKDFKINKLTLSSDRLLITSLDTSVKPFLLNNDGRLSSFPVDSKELLNPCFINSDLYYISSDKKNIYQYSTDQKTAFLLYTTYINTIEDVFCDDNGFMFSLSADNNQLYKYFLLTDTDLGSDETRVEEFTPISWTYKADTYEITQTESSVRVKIVYDSDGNGRSPDNELISELNKLFSDKGINTNKIKYVFE